MSGGVAGDLETIAAVSEVVDIGIYKYLVIDGVDRRHGEHAALVRLNGWVQSRHLFSS